MRCKTDLQFFKIKLEFSELKYGNFIRFFIIRLKCFSQRDSKTESFILKQFV